MDDKAMLLRKAAIRDVAELTSLINHDGSILPRSQHYVFENLRDFTVVQENGRIVGCGSLHVLWEDVAEIRSVTFADPELARNGVFRQLLDRLLDEGRQLGVKQVLALTYDPESYLKHGFREVERAQVQRLVWNECINCVHFPDCMETPVIVDLDQWDKDKGSNTEEVTLDRHFHSLDS